VTSGVFRSWQRGAMASAQTASLAYNGRTDAQVILYCVQCYCIALDRQWT